MKKITTKLYFARYLPIKIYSNVAADKATILKENQQKSGIYIFTNLINGNRYIGSAQDLSVRLYFYFSATKMNSALKQGKSYICSSILKNGLENFSIKILEYCKIEDLLKREKYYIDYLESEFNIIKDPTLPPMLGRSHLEESKTKMSDAKKGENNPNYGQNHSDETKKIMSDAAKKIDHSGRFKPGQPRVEGSGKPSQQIEVTDIKNNTTTSFNSMSEAARALNLPSYKEISDYIKNNQQKPYKGRYTFHRI
jgi:group I intron endonuclease